MTEPEDINTIATWHGVLPAEGWYKITINDPTVDEPYWKEPDLSKIPDDAFYDLERLVCWAWVTLEGGEGEEAYCYDVMVGVTYYCPPNFDGPPGLNELHVTYMHKDDLTEKERHSYAERARASIERDRQAAAKVIRDIEGNTDV